MARSCGGDAVTSLAAAALLEDCAGMTMLRAVISPPKAPEASLHLARAGLGFLASHLILGALLALLAA
jgi:hypothetical protein